MDSISMLIDKYHENLTQRPRPYLGPSSAGITCDRALWYQFRWVKNISHPGRVLRLFRRGQMEEAVAQKDLEAIGCRLSHTGNNQITVWLAPHVIGHPDGVLSGLPGSTEVAYIWECKTHNKKSFDDLEKNGVEKSKLGHYIQTQLYMHGTNPKKALYYADCKDDDRIYTEIVEYQKECAEKALARLSRIIFADYSPARISDNPAWYECKMCSFFNVCHQGKLPQRNCRTCLHSSPGKVDRWHCALDDGDLDLDFQIEACRGHVPHPDLVPWPLVGDKCTRTSGYFEGIGLVGVEGIDSSTILRGTE